MAVPYTFIHGEKRRLTTMYFQIKMKGEEIDLIVQILLEIFFLFLYTIEWNFYEINIFFINSISFQMTKGSNGIS